MTNWVSEGDRVESWGPFAESSDQPVGTDPTPPGSQDTGPSVGSMSVKGHVPKEQPGQAAPAGSYCGLMACSHGDADMQDGSAGRPGSVLARLSTHTCLALQPCQMAEPSCKCGQDCGSSGIAKSWGL